jgi:hypothetical protein
VVVTALARRCSSCGENLIMNLAIEKELKCTIPVCMICYLRAISETHMPWRRIIASCMGDWAEEIKEMLKRKRVLAVEIEKMERIDKAMKYEGPVQFRN